VASSAGQVDIAWWVFQHGSNVNAQDDERCNPLHVLLQEGHLEIPAPSQLSDDVPFPKLRNYHDGTSDPESRQRGQSVEVAHLLLKHWVDVDAKGRSGRTVGEIGSAK
jgi:hypothetical protein